MLQVLEEVEKKYAPQVQNKTPSEVNKPTIINQANKDSGIKKDTNK
jgi:hypothetical protein